MKRFYVIVPVWITAILVPFDTVASWELNSNISWYFLRCFDLSGDGVLPAIDNEQWKIHWVKLLIGLFFPAPQKARAKEKDGAIFPWVNR